MKINRQLHGELLVKQGIILCNSSQTIPLLRWQNSMYNCYITQLSSKAFHLFNFYSLYSKKGKKLTDSFILAY